MHRKSTSNKTPFPKGLAQPALRALASAGYDHMEQLAGVPESEVRELHGIGPHALRKLRDAMSALGLSFATSESADTTAVPSNFADLCPEDRGRQGAAFQQILDQTSQPVDWTYDVWDELLAQTRDKNNRNRSIAAQVLCNLAKSDPSKRMLRDFPALFDVVTHKRFVDRTPCFAGHVEGWLRRQEAPRPACSRLGTAIFGLSHAQELHLDPLRHYRVPSEAV